MVPTRSTLLARPADVSWLHTWGLQQVISVIESPRSTFGCQLPFSKVPGSQPEDETNLLTLTFCAATAPTRPAMRVNLESCIETE